MTSRWSAPSRPRNLPKPTNWPCAPVDLQTVCVRHEPPGCAGEDLDRHTLAWADAVNAGGRAFVSPSMLDGRWMVRISIGAEATQRADVEALWALLRQEASATP